MTDTYSRKRYVKNNILVQRNTQRKKNVMASLLCHGNSDCKETQIIRNFHLYIIQLW